MNKFDQLGKKDEVEEPVNGMEIEVCFQCQICDEMVDLAEYQPSKSRVVWTCPNGHVSKMNGFEL